MNFIKKLPYPISGTALGFAVLGNLLTTYHPLFKPICGIISAIIIFLLLIKVITMTITFKDAMARPLVASSFATFPMAIMVLSTYIPKGTLAKTVWATGFVLHVLLILWFSWRYVVKNFTVESIFPSWFIVYVGLATASVVAPYHQLTVVGMGAFWFAFTTYLILLPLVSWRLIKLGPLPLPAKPTLMIYAAPASLLLAGYMSSANSKSLPMVYFILTLSLLFYALSLLKLPTLLSLPFAPSYSSFTFPFVISSTAARSTYLFLSDTSQGPQWLSWIVKMQPWIALALCTYTLIRFAQFQFTPLPMAKTATVK